MSRSWMSGFGDPRNIAYAKRQLNELCPVISQEHGFHLYVNKKSWSRA